MPLPYSKKHLRSCFALFYPCFIFAWIASAPTVSAQTDLKIRDICRVKGQESNVLQGVGLVVGLKGTGDGDSIKAANRMLAQAILNMGGPVGLDSQGKLIEKEMANAKNVALVTVEVVVPPAGAEQGEELNCVVNAIGAKSIDGGTLMQTALWGPRADQKVIYGLARGQIVADDRKVPTSGKITKGCKIETPIHTEFVANNKITLIVNPSHASFNTTLNIEDAINNLSKINEPGTANSSAQSPGAMSPGQSSKLAKAIDQAHVEVKIPPVYQDNPVSFVWLILDRELINLQSSKRVVIQRDNSIIIGEDVLIAPVAIQHANLNITPRNAAGPKFVGLSSRDGSKLKPTLSNLVDALNTLNVPSADIVSIIKGIERQGNLYGELVVE